MAKLLKVLEPEITIYRDRRFQGTEEEWQERLRTSTTVYVGNLSFYTSEEQLYELFSRAGEVKRVVMGLDKKLKTPCGFCFVIYKTRLGADSCVKYVNGTKLDERPIRVDYDWGYEEGHERQYGRGRSGGQVRDEFRVDYDPDRGGYGKKIAEAWQRQVQQSFDSVATSEGPTPPPPSKRQKHTDEEQPNPRFRGQDDEEEE